jgi:hypothetical protein
LANQVWAVKCVRTRVTKWFYLSLSLSHPHTYTHSTHAHAHTRAQAHNNNNNNNTHKHTHTHTRARARKHTQTHTHKHIQTHTHKHTHTSTHAHARTRTSQRAHWHHASPTTGHARGIGPRRAACRAMCLCRSLHAQVLDRDRREIYGCTCPHASELPCVRKRVLQQQNTMTLLLVLIARFVCACLHTRA